MLRRVLNAHSISPQNSSETPKGAKNQRVYEFGPFRVDEARGVLLKNGEEVPLVPKAFDLLMLLVESGGETLEKADLMKALWPESFVEEGNLTQTVFVLRKALGEDSQSPRYIVTAPRRGYRLAAEVRFAPRVQSSRNW